MEIKTFGPVDERSRKQLVTCMKAGDADFGVLCADHHPGYSQPIGGAIAYEGYISPSGVGYDIACVAAGEQVQTADGYTLPVERAAAPVCADAAGMLRPIVPFIGIVARGSKPVVRVVLANGRSLLCTADHQIRTDRGWLEASSLSTDDSVLCPVYTGLPFERGELPVELLRVAGYVNGDGHITANGRRVTLYTSIPRDAYALAADLRSLGYEPRIHARTLPNGSHESAVYVNSRELSDRLAILGPVGSKAGRWGHVLDALRPLPRWARGAYLSAFASAEMSTPRLLAGNIPSLTLKQKGRDAIEVVAGLLRSLDFTVGVTRSDRGSYVAQLQGGEDEQIRFMAEIGFSRAAGKRRAAAAVAGHAWARHEHIATRRRAQRLVRERVRAGAHVRTGIAEVAAAAGLTPPPVRHLLYRRGTLRRALGWECEVPRALGECAWSSVASVAPVGERETWDIVTADPEEAFVAGGMAVHNCGNKAVRTDMRRADIGAVGPVMGEIARRVSFGMGVPAREQVDHPVLNEIEQAAFEPQRKLAGLARKQLGTVGSGNHYVNLFADEEDTLWVGVHFGSRGFGHKTASGFLALAQGLPFDDAERKRLGLKVREGEMDSPPVLFEVDSEVGQGYIEAMRLAGEYAYAGRDVVVGKVLEILGAEATYGVHNHHNFCIAGDQIVPTSSGAKRMDEITIGDEVYAFSDSGPQATRVIDAWRSGERSIYTVSVGSRQLRCSGSHPILVLDGGHVVWRNAENLVVGDIAVCADGFYPREYSWGADRARLVGAFLGDGWLRHEHHERGYTLGLAIGTGEERHTHRYAELVKTILSNTGWGQGWRIDAPGHYGLSCSSKSAWTAAVAMGLGQRAAEKRLPSEAFSLTRDEKLALLGGYFDADGSVAGARTSNHGRGTIASVSKGLVQDLRELAIGCGLQVTRIIEGQRVTNMGACVVYRCTIAAGSMSDVPLWHDDKAGNQRSTTRDTKGLTDQYLGGAKLPQGFFGRRVQSIAISEAEPVYDLTVEHDSHSFIVEGIVTHNCWRERHLGRDVWVVRKGCTPAEPGQEGFVGATMGDDSVILEGVDSAEAQAALRSTVHGAGRVMSRSQAAGRVKRRTVYECSERDCDFTVPARDYDGQSCPRHPSSRMRKLSTQTVVRKGVVDWPAVQERLRGQGIVVVGGGADEAPEVYKDLGDVLAAHEGTIRVKHTLTPIGVAMAGRDVLDPYKD